jgi:hypothetical protein
MIEYQPLDVEFFIDVDSSISQRGELLIESFRVKNKGANSSFFFLNIPS